MSNHESCLFQSQVRRTPALDREIRRGCFYCNPWLSGAHLTLILIFLWFFFEMVLHMDAMDTYAITVPFMVVLWLAFEIIRRLTSRSENLPEEAISFYPDEIRAGPDLVLSYDRITAVWETRHLILCLTRDRTLIPVSKDSLSGTREDFLTFLLPKCTSLALKKVLSPRPGQFLHILKYAVMALSLAVAILFHPWIQMENIARGRIHNHMPVAQILEQLADFGITDDGCEAVHNLDNPLAYLPHTKLEKMLMVLGSGSTDPDTGHWFPAETGLFFTPYGGEGLYSKTMYTKVLHGIDTMCGDAVVIEDIVEDHSGAGEDIRRGEIVVHFTLNGTPQTIVAGAPASGLDWLHLKFFELVGSMIEASTGKNLCFCAYQDTALFIFLGDDQDASDFTRHTGLFATTRIKDLIA